MHATPFRKLAPLASALILACSSAPASPGPSGAGSVGLPPGHPVVQAPRLDKTAEPAPGPMTGVVRETLKGGGYTYARVDFEGDLRWVAGPQIDLVVGDTVSVADMTNVGAFSSPTLGRSFEELYFTGAFVRPGDPAVEHRGLVSQAIPAGSYVYLEVDSGGATRWLAAPALEVAAGDSVGWNGGTTMKDFSSRTLGRTFAEILFVAAVTVLR